MSERPALVVFSHLRWNFVYQRPQHLISRLAKSRRVLFIEEPLHTNASEPHFTCREGAPNVLICEPHTQATEPGFSDQQNALLRPLLANLLREQGVSDFVVWFYSPMAFPLIGQLSPRATVYDCMDELSAFANAPPELLQRETKLLAAADVVFTGGPSLYRAKKDRHPRVHCFPSSVDAQHFGQGRPGGQDARQQSSVSRPRLGFFGVIDERFDAKLLDEVARSRPHWQFVMVGPIVKIDSATLPLYPNIHYFSQQPYDGLPRFLAGWDVCLLPFARNDATRFISPTKTLEYMAAERMIVSTPITDVAEPYGDIVFLGDSPASFRDACERALSVTDNERETRVAKMRAVLARTSWDATARAMAEIIDEIADSRSAEAQSKGLRNRNGSSQPLSISKNASVRVTPLEDSTLAKSRHLASPILNRVGSVAKTVIIGAGPTGLSAAYHASGDTLLLEANDRVGGWCRSLEVNGFTFDFAGHIMFSNDSYVHKMYETLLGDNVHWQDREAWIFSKGVHTRYPFQGSLYGLPAEVIKECIIGAIEARYGGPRTSAVNGAAPSCNGHHRGDANGQTGTCAHDIKELEDCCGDGVMESTAQLVSCNGNADAAHNGHANVDDALVAANFEEFIYKVWGRGIAKHFAIPYNRKLWAVPLSEMETSWLGGRVPMPDLEEMVEGALKPAPKPMGPNARFGYPRRGGFQALMDGFLPYVADKLRLGTRVSRVSPTHRAVYLDDGEEIQYETLINTMPLPALVSAIGDEAPATVRQAATELRNVSVRCVHLGIGRERLTEKHWIYYPEETVFHRIFVQGNASPHCNAPGGFGLTCEITYSPHKPLPCDGEALVRRCIDDCVKVGIIRADDEIWASAQCDLPYAYVVYDHARPKNVKVIRKWLEEQDIILAGRYSEWEYYNSDHAFLAGKHAAEAAERRRIVFPIPGKAENAAL